MKIGTASTKNNNTHQIVNKQETKLFLLRDFLA